jgi:hypothetical protein
MAQANRAPRDGNKIRPPPFPVTGQILMRTNDYACLAKAYEAIKSTQVFKAFQPIGILTDCRSCLLDLVCGTEVSATAKFCSECGARVTGSGGQQ